MQITIAKKILKIKFWWPTKSSTREMKSCSLGYERKGQVALFEGGYNSSLISFLLVLGFTSFSNQQKKNQLHKKHLGLLSSVWPWVKKLTFLRRQCRMEMIEDAVLVAFILLDWALCQNTYYHSQLKLNFDESLIWLLRIMIIIAFTGESVLCLSHTLIYLLPWCRWKCYACIARCMWCFILISR